MYSFAKRKVSRTGLNESPKWTIGHGYVREKLTVQSEVWCVLHDDRVIAECRSEKQAETITVSLNTVAYFNHK